MPQASRDATETIDSIEPEAANQLRQMLLTMHRAQVTVSSGEEYSWLEARFGNYSFASEEQLPLIVDEIRSGLFASDAALANTLADHLQDRFSELDQALYLIVEKSGRAASKEEALRTSQYYAECQRTTARQRPSASTFVPKYTLKLIQLLAERLPQLRVVPSRIVAFAHFAAIEKDLELVEESVHEVVEKNQ